MLSLSDDVARFKALVVDGPPIAGLEKACREIRRSQDECVAAMLAFVRDHGGYGGESTQPEWHQALEIAARFVGHRGASRFLLQMQRDPVSARLRGGIRAIALLTGSLPNGHDVSRLVWHASRALIGEVLTECNDDGRTPACRALWRDAEDVARILCRCNPEGAFVSSDGRMAAVELAVAQNRRDLADLMFRSVGALPGRRVQRVMRDMVRDATPPVLFHRLLTHIGRYTGDVSFLFPEVLAWGMPDMLEELLNHEIRLETTDHMKRTLLLQAASSSDTLTYNDVESFLEKLLARGANPNAVDYTGRTVLMHFVRHIPREWADALGLGDMGPDPCFEMLASACSPATRMATDRAGDTVLHHLFRVEKTRRDRFESYYETALLPQLEACRNTENRAGKTPLVVALESGAPVFVTEGLVSRGFVGRNLLEAAAKGASLDNVRFFVDRGRLDGAAIRAACALDEDRADIVTLLASTPGVDLVDKDADGRSPLHIYLGRAPYGEELRLLVRPEVINTQDRLGKTPLMLSACCSSGLRMLEALLDSGADPTLLDAHGWSALDHLVDVGATDNEILLLLDRGAPFVPNNSALLAYIESGGRDPTILHRLWLPRTDPTAATALMDAIKRQSRDVIIPLLLQHTGEDPSQRDRFGRGALHHYLATADAIDPDIMSSLFRPGLESALALAAKRGSAAFRSLYDLFHPGQQWERVFDRAADGSGPCHDLESVRAVLSGDEIRSRRLAALHDKASLCRYMEHSARVGRKRRRVPHMSVCGRGVPALALEYVISMNDEVFSELMSLL